MTVRLILACVVLCLGLAGIGATQDANPKKADAFYAGTVLESTSQKITVSRVVRGKAQKRSFRVTPDTKVEGKLRIRVRVTVRYVTDEDGDTATRIVVRVAPPPKQP